MKNSRSIGDISGRYNASYMTDARSRLYEYNKFKFAASSNLQRSRSLDANAVTFQYAMYQDEIKTLCGKYTSATACYDIRNALLVIGSRAYFSKKPEGGKEALEGKKKAKTIGDDSSPVGLTTVNKSLFDLDDDDEDDDDFMDTGDDDEEDDEFDDESSDSGDEEEEVSRSSLKRRRESDQKGRPVKKQKTSESSYHKYAKRNKRPKSNDKFKVLAKGRITGKSRWVKVQVSKESAQKLMDAIVISKYDPRKRDTEVDKIVVNFSQYHL